MDFLEGFRDGRYAKVLVEEIEEISDQPLRFMEFCGGHTAAVLKYGIKGLLPPNIEMLSGPGCPVCVTSCSEIDHAIKFSQGPEIILTSFGDMFKIRGSRMSLSEQKALGADIRTIYSPDDAIKIAIDNPGRTVIFFAIGFETTAPVTAAALKLAKKNNIQNFYIYSAHKTTPGILKVLVSGEIKIDGFLCPGHVTTITGTSIYDTLISAGKPCVVSGFEPLDILQSIYLLIKQIDQGRAEVENQYKRVTTSTGNRMAQALMDEVFEPTDAYWRGIGIIPGTGLKPRGTFRQFDAAEEFALDKTSLENEEETPGCICGSILKGLRTPLECPLFRKTCMPENPVGACMVSEEGTCSIYFRFGQKVNE
jgi:hydrogenase expression/formation protein HypD